MGSSQEINPDLEIERVFKVPEEIGENTVVADIGGGKFDHHQVDAALRDDGRKHAACGLVLQEFEPLLFENGASKGTAFKDEIEKIEDVDNMVFRDDQSVLSELVSGMNPNWDSDKNVNECFSEAVDFVRENFVEPSVRRDGQELSAEEKKVLQSKLEEVTQRREESKERAKELVNAAIEKSDGNIVVLDKFAPWQAEVCKTDVSFVVFPSLRGGYGVQCVPPTPESFEKRIPLPQEWLESAPEGAQFVHPGRFFAQFDSVENAKKALEPVLKHEKNEKVMDTMKNAENLDEILNAVMKGKNKSENTNETKSRDSKTTRNDDGAI